MVAREEAPGVLEALASLVLVEVPAEVSLEALASVGGCRVPGLAVAPLRAGSGWSEETAAWPSSA